MIKLKLNFDGENSKTFDIKDGESASEAVARALKDVPSNGFELSDVFHVTVNGLLIDTDFLPITKLKSADTVVISPKIKSGESGQIFKQVAILAVAIVASVYLSPAVGGGIYGALATAAVTIGASLVLNGLIPPPVPGPLDGLGTGGDVSSSQMYTISGQSNQVKPMGLVPKVYGKHRMFPNVVANPYAELTTDPATGQPAQYLNVIYDFGMGPAKISDIKIGDTPLTSEFYEDFQYRIVDPNRPDVDEGEWDAGVSKEFTIYKGDYEGNSLGVGLNGNQSDGDPQDTWEAIRNSAANETGSEQEIILNFINPTGLYGFNSTGNKDYRRIQLDIQFAKVGTEDWHYYNDLDHVKNFDSVGGMDTDFEISANIAATDSSTSFPHISGQQYENSYYQINGLTPIYSSYSQPPLYQEGRLFIQPLSNKVLVHWDGLTEYTPGRPVFLNGEFLGNVSSTSVYATGILSITLTLPVGRYVDTGITMRLQFVTGVLYPVTDPPHGIPTANYNGFNTRHISSGLGVSRIQRAETAPVYSSFRFTPKNTGQYKVRVRRIATTGPYSTNVQDDLTWSTIFTRFSRTPVTTEKRHRFLELRIRATSQLNGTIQNLSAVVESALDVYDGVSWTKQITNNPAWVFCDLLTGEVNKKPVDRARLDMTSITEWADYCDEEPPTPNPSYELISPHRFSCNFVLDYTATLQTVLGQVTGSAQASLNIIDGKYGVLVDRFKTTPVQIFTPRNSKDFNSSRIYTGRPHGLKVKYIDPFADWSVAEVVVYDNGYDENTATEIEDMTAFACTDLDQAWRFGRYMIAQNRLRQETITITTDFEHMVCTRGDYVQITQDVMKVGGRPARVKAVSGTVITTDDSFDIDPLINYGYALRKSTGVIATSTLTATSPNTFDVDGDVPAIGDLVVIGAVGSIVYDCIVKSITPNDDLSATIVLIEKADGIYDYESTGTIPDYSPQISPTSGEAKAPGAVENLVVADFGHECNANGNGYDYFVDLAWDPAQNSIHEFFSILVDSGSGYNEVATTRQSIYRYIVEPEDMGVQHSFKVIAVSATGKKREIVAVPSVTSTPVEKTTPPSDVGRLSIDITNEVIQFSWPQILDCDAKEYLIRYSTESNGSWESSIPLLRAAASATLASAQARTGLYLIKAVDFAGNESANAAYALTTIPNLFNLNVIESISDAPTWGGALDRVRVTAGSLVLETESTGPSGDFYYSEGYYYYTSLIDLGDIYSVRLQSLIRAEGFSIADLMSNWPTLSSVSLLSNSLGSEWSIETQYRSSNEFNVISNWTTLSSILALNEGVNSVFTDWRTFYIGDATGRIFQFRLKFISNNQTVSPRIFDGTIKADMPDRIESFENILADDTNGATVNYSSAFKGPGTSPNVQISIDGAESGDYWVFDYKTLEGFKIKFYDKNDVQVARQFDAAIKGYGRTYSAVI